jgi:hypothetical protein
VTLDGSVAGIGRCRYGASAVWSLSEDLAGSEARRFAGRVGLFFRREKTALLVDLRGAGLIDSAGAAALSHCRSLHQSFGVVGRPASWADLPAPVRIAVQDLCPAPDLETALAATTAADRAGIPEQRRHPRIPLQIPVEVVCAGHSALGALRDISRGGVRLSDLPDGWLGDLRRAGAVMTLGLLGLDADPLGRELTAGRGHGLVPAVPVCALPGGILGARFADAHPPV